MHTRILPLLSGSALALSLAFSSVASAAEELDDCGGIFLSGDASCEYVPKQECETSCQTTSVEQSCIATLSTECESMCTATATTECTRDCETSCVQDCAATPQTSKGLCNGECGGDCTAECQTSGDARCKASCSHNCDSQCEHHCHDDDQDVECSTKCGTTCEGRCTATATVSCQRDCQTTQFESCQTTTVETCKTDCHDKGGAIFCDGQFVNASDLEACAAQIEAKISVHVDLNVTGAVDIDTNNDGKNDVSCSVSPRVALMRAAGTTSIVTTLFALLGALFIVRRRRF